MSVDVTLKHCERSDSILLGYSIGSAELPHGRRLDITGSGRLLRFTVSGIEGYVDLDLSEIATEAAIMLTGRTLAEEAIADA